MVEFTTNQLYALVSAYFWPLVRIMGLFTSAPLFSNRAIPSQVRVSLAIGITFLVAPTLPAFPEQDPLSWTGLLILTQQFLIGISIGFAMRLIFTGIELAGEIIGMTMGFGFATFFDPQSQGRSSSLSQLLAMLTMLFLIASDFHLLLIECVVDSFRSLPIGEAALGKSSFKQLAFWGGEIFMIGLQLSLPAVTALLIANMALGVLTRAAPQLNLFGIGFPITLLTGLLMFDLMLSYWSLPLLDLLQQGISMVRQLMQPTL
jgi:flagellar biosynthetic protein FliR